VSERGDNLLDLQRCRGACLRYQGRVRAKGNRLLGASDTQEADRSTSQCCARSEIRRHSGHNGRTGVRHRLECRLERTAIRRLSELRDAATGLAAWRRFGNRRTGFEACPTVEVRQKAVL